MYSWRKGASADDGLFQEHEIISADGGFVFNAVCDSSTIVVPAEEGLKERLEAVLAETKLQEYKVTEGNGQISIYAKGVPAHASTPDSWGQCNRCYF